MGGTTPISLREVFGNATLFASDADELGTALLAAAGGHDAAQRGTGESLAARHTWAMAATAHRVLYRSFG